jgi:hypothetical protein
MHWSPFRHCADSILMTKGGSALAMMRDGERIISSLAAEFFGNVVHDEETRQPEDFCYLARLHEWAGECEQAFAVLAQGRSLYPGYWEIPFQHASFRGRAGEPDAALDDAEQATQLAPWKTQT